MSPPASRPPPLLLRLRPGPALTGAALLGCVGAPTEAERYARALKAGDPAACRALTDEDLRADCLLASVEAEGPARPERAAAICEELAAGVWQDECWFVLAERARRPELCEKAGRFQDDCRLHALSARIVKVVGPRPPGAFEEHLRPVIQALGFAADDPRPWSAGYRFSLESQHPLDRGSCEAAPADPRLDLRTVCRQTALAVFDDRINRARDRRLVPCPDGPLPEALAFLPDPDLEARLAERRAADLCR